MDFLKVKMTHILLTMSLLITVTSCATTFYVAPLQADCDGAGAQKCYLVRRNANENWILLYSQIEGFDYEPGFAYRIEVKRKRIKHPPADGPKYKYILEEVIDKKDVTADIAVDDLTGKQWQLEYLHSGGVSYLIGDVAPTILFGADGKINGFAGCNNYFGTYTIDGRTIRFSGIGATRKMCQESMDLEDAFLKMLSMDLRALFDENKLVLSGDGGNRMIFRLDNH